MFAFLRIQSGKSWFRKERDSYWNNIPKRQEEIRFNAPGRQRLWRGAGQSSGATVTGRVSCGSAGLLVGVFRGSFLMASAFSMGSEPMIGKEDG